MTQKQRGGSAAWPVARLAEVAEIVMGQSPPGDTYNNARQGLPFFQGKADFGKQFPTARTWCTRPSRVAEPGDILISVRAPVGPTNVASERCCIGRGLAAIRATPSVLDQGYLRFFLKKQEPELSHRGQGSTFAAIKRNEIEGLEIPLPPLSEQRRIVEILDQADRLRRLRAEADAKADRILPALFIKMFGDPATNPMGWPVVEIGSVSRVVRGASPRPKGDPRYFGGSIPWITISDVHRAGRYLRDTREGLTEEGARRSVLLPSETLILSNSGSVGTPCVLLIAGCIHDGFLAFLDLDPAINRDFLYATFLLEQSRLRALAPAGTQANLNTGLIKRFRVMLPPRSRQDEFVEILESLEKHADAASDVRRRIEGLWKTMLARAFSGSLTASWREAHMKDLLQEMEQQAKALEAAKT